MPNFILTEPAPSTTSYVRSGRGGAGNISRAPKTTSHHKTTSHTATTSAAMPSRRFYSGIGGAGNVHEASERPALSLEEEYDRAAARELTNVGHCGIGGAGNVYRRKASDASSDASSQSSFSSKSNLWARVSSTFHRD